jgi:serine/threonine-protein kinase
MLNPDLLGLNPLFGQVKGTPGYMAPEQVEKNSECSVQTDIYGLGCILYSILTLHCPVEGEVEDALRKTVEGEILSPALRTPGRNIPKSLNAVVLKATAIKPAYRYESVAVFRKEVHRFLTGFATQAENAGVLTQFALFYSRNRRFCLTILTSLLILLGGLSWSFWILNTKEHAASEARHMAEQTLRLYQAGQSELEQMSFQTAASVVKYVEQRHLQTDERGALSLLQAALENEPDNPVYLRALGQYWFIQHRFDLAVTYFDRGIHPEDEIHNIARFYAGLNLEGRRLSAEQMVDVLRRLNGHEDLELMMIVNDQKQRVNLRERALIIEEYLHTINPDWEEGWFEFDAEKSSLRIGGRNLRKLANSHSVLVGLQPRMLDISGSDIEHMWRETGYAIETLNACDVEFTELYFLTRFVHLKKLIVRQGQLSAKEWSIVPEWVRVIEQ